jgi:hypothetical protein
METRTPTVPRTRVLDSLRTTAWYENFCGAWAKLAAITLKNSAKVIRILFIVVVLLIIC